MLHLVGVSLGFSFVLPSEPYVIVSHHTARREIVVKGLFCRCFPFCMFYLGLAILFSSNVCRSPLWYSSWWYLHRGTCFRRCAPTLCRYVLVLILARTSLTVLMWCISRLLGDPHRFPYASFLSVCCDCQFSC